MTFTLHTPWVPIVILGVVLVIVIFSMLIKWKGTVKTLVSLLVILALFIFVGSKILNPGKLIVNDEGFFFDSRGNESIYWSDIDKATVIEDLSNTEYNPTSRIRGTTSGKLRTGWFKLKDGKRARLLMEVRNSAVVIECGDDTYLLAPADFKIFVSEVGRHISLE